MDEENNNSESKIKELAKKGAEKVSQAIKKKIIMYLPTILTVIGYILLAILAYTVLYLLVDSVISFFAAIISFFSPSKTADSSATTSGINQTSCIVYIDEDTGAYKLQDNFAEQIIENLESNSIDAEAAGFIKDNLENMLDKYIKAEVQTMFPKTGLAENDIDGLITVQRASTDRKWFYKNFDIQKV